MKKNKIPNFLDLGIDLKEKLPSIMPDYSVGTDGGIGSIPPGKLQVRMLPDIINGGLRRGELFIMGSGGSILRESAGKSDVRGAYLRKMLNNATVGINHQILADGKVVISLERKDDSSVRSHFPIQHPLPTDQEGNSMMLDSLSLYKEYHSAMKPTANETSPRKVQNSTLSGRSYTGPEFDRMRNYWVRNQPAPIFNSQETPFIARLANFILDHRRQSKLPYRKTWLGFLIGDLKYGPKPAPVFPPANKYEQLEEALEYYASYMTWYQSHMEGARRITSAEVLTTPEGIWWSRRQPAKRHF